MSKKSQKCSGNVKADRKSKWYSGAQEIIFDDGTPPYCEAAREEMYNAIVLRGNGPISVRCKEFSDIIQTQKQLQAKFCKSNNH